MDTTNGLGSLWVTLQNAPHIEAKKIGNKVYVRGEFEAQVEASTLWSLNGALLREKLEIPNYFIFKTENFSFGKYKDKSFFLVELSV